MINIDFSKAPIHDNFKRLFEKTLTLLYETNTCPFIVEVASIRAKNSVSDGNSSEMFAWAITNYGGKFYTCNINSIHADLCQEVLSKYKGNWHVCYTSGETFLENLNSSGIDLLYLDSFDYHDEKDRSEQHHLELFKLSEKKMNPGGLILIDDIMNVKTYEGKGRLLIPYLIDNGYELLEEGYQFLFRVPMWEARLCNEQL